VEACFGGEIDAPCPAATVSVTKPLLLAGGEYDVARKDDLRAELDKTEPHSDVVLDLARTEFIDCSCIGVLIAKLHAWREEAPGTKLRLQNVSPSIARILGLLELELLFVIDSTREAAPGELST
jgi:anti-anti-sigma factor